MRQLQKTKPGTLYREVYWYSNLGIALSSADHEEWGNVLKCPTPFRSSFIIDLGTGKLFRHLLIVLPAQWAAWSDVLAST
jgi:hypothetical protein